ncbi:MAG TPA: hypothetical protein VFY65_13735, partial [Longimicrobium sp.]|nr:hypothetical protein [Longimicrobium sp.]
MRRPRFILHGLTRRRRYANNGGSPHRLPSIESRHILDREPTSPGQPAPRRWWRWWLIATAWWTLEGLTDAVGFYRMLRDAGDSSLGWSLVLRGNMGSAWLWIPPSILALWVVDRWPLERDAWPRRLGVYALASAAVCLFRAVAVVLLNEWMVWYTELPGFGEIMITSIINNLLLFWMLLAVGHALVYARRYRERDEQLARAQ